MPEGLPLGRPGEHHVNHAGPAERHQGVTGVRNDVAAATEDALPPSIEHHMSIRPQETFDSFYRRQYPGLVALARALSGRGGSAEDLAQEAMMVAFRRWDEVCLTDHPAAWVRGSAPTSRPPHSVDVRPRYVRC